MKIIHLTLLLMFQSILFFGQDTPEKITENFFKIYVNNKKNALDTIFFTNKYFSQEQTNEVSKKLNDLVSIIGDYCGNEFIQKQSAGNSFVLYKYVVKYERQPLKFTFVFYKPKETWVLYNFNFESDLDTDLENVAKINLFLNSLPPPR